VGKNNTYKIGGHRNASKSPGWWNPQSLEKREGRSVRGGKRKNSAPLREMYKKNAGKESELRDEGKKEAR